MFMEFELFLDISKKKSKKSWFLRCCPWHYWTLLDSVYSTARYCVMFLIDFARIWDKFAKIPRTYRFSAFLALIVSFSSSFCPSGVIVPEPVTMLFHSHNPKCPGRCRQTSLLKIHNKFLYVLEAAGSSEVCICLFVPYKSKMLQ